jgi:hypothetical protein
VIVSIRADIERLYTKKIETKNKFDSLIKNENTNYIMFKFNDYFNEIEFIDAQIKSKQDYILTYTYDCIDYYKSELKRHNPLR